MENCRHKRVIKVSDQPGYNFSWSFEGKTFEPEYPPTIDGLCGNDGFEMEICMDCHQVIDLSTEDIEYLIDENSEPEEATEEDESDEDDV